MSISSVDVAVGLKREQNVDIIDFCDETVGYKASAVGSNGETLTTDEYEEFILGNEIEEATFRNSQVTNTGGSDMKTQRQAVIKENIFLKYCVLICICVLILYLIFGNTANGNIWTINIDDLVM